MKIAFIMDPLEYVKPEKDTTYYIMLAARERGHEVFSLDQNDLFLDDGTLYAKTKALDVHAQPAAPFTVLSEQDSNLNEMDVVLIRTDPPFDRRYFYTTLFLEQLGPQTLVLNKPQTLRNWNEKLAALFYREFTPKTLITRDAGKIIAFMEENGRVTLKPIDGFAGRGIVFLNKDSENRDALIAMVTENGSHQIICQKYLPAASEGDKRILLVDGEPIGAILRLHAEGKELNNLDAGGSAHPTELTPKEKQICEAMREDFKREGLYFVGIDIIGESLIEVNVTSPTGLRQLCDFNGVAYHHQIIEGMEKKVAALKQ